MSINIDVKTAKIGFWHFPKIFYAVIFIEFWERFAFYGFQAVGVVYFIQKYHMTEANSSELFSSLSALMYALMVVGGVIGDKLLGIRRTYLLGIITFIIGYGLLSIANSESLLYFAMGIIVVGNLLFKTNANNYVGRCFENNDPRLDSAYTYFYMSINIGGMIGLVLVPIISRSLGYYIGLLLCIFAMLIALVFLIVYKSRFALSDNQVGKNESNKFGLTVLIFVIGILFAYVAGLILRSNELSRWLMVIASVVFAVVYLFVAFRLPKHESKGMLIAFVLLLQSIVFWVLYMQLATSFVLFTYYNINLNILGYELPTGSTQLFNPIYIVILSPILANVYLKFHKQQIDVGIPFKFAFGIFVCSVCYFLLAFVSSFFVNSVYQISVIWLFIAVGFYSLGELLVSALGPSMVAKLLPKRIGGFAQGVWYLTAAIGIKLGGVIASFASSEYRAHNVSAKISLTAFNHMFYSIGIIILLIAIVLFFMVKPLTKNMLQVLKHR